MNYKTLQCRDHGGSFEVVAKRGRPPTRCSEDNVCDMHPALQGSKASPAIVAGLKKAATRKRVTKTTTELLEQNEKRFKSRSTLTGVNKSSLRTSKWCKCDEQGGERHEKGIEGCRYATRGAPVSVKQAPAVVRHNPSIQMARRAKEQLEPLGWECAGRAWFESFDVGNGDEFIGWAEVTASRGIETLIIRWKNGKLDSQNYLAWNEEAPQENAMPKHRLPFNPDEMTDSELIKAISGSKVTWWNRIAQGNEHGTLGDKIQIEHSFTGAGNEMARIIKFADAESKRFRAFHVSALMKVG